MPEASLSVVEEGSSSSQRMPPEAEFGGGSSTLEHSTNPPPCPTCQWATGLTVGGKKTLWDFPSSLCPMATQSPWVPYFPLFRLFFISFAHLFSFTCFQGKGKG